MNELNYASLEASKKLYEAGIIIKTECDWICFKGAPTGYAIEQKWRIPAGKYEHIPAPCFTEVWRELPESITKGGTIQYLEMGKTGNKTYAVYDFADDYVLFENPTDALIELKIWLEKEKGK